MPTNPDVLALRWEASKSRCAPPGLVGDRTRSAQDHSIAEPLTQTIQRQREAAHPGVFPCLRWVEIKQRQLLLGGRQGFREKRYSANADPPLEAT